MSQFDDGGLPHDLSEVADQLRSHRYEASALELDQAKARILKRASGQRAARGGGMHKKTLLTTLIMFAALGTGTATALDLSGLIRSLPVVGRLRPAPPAAAPAAPAAPANAAISMYGTRFSVTIVRCRPVVIGRGGTTTCTATVIGTTRVAPTGTVTFSNGATCTLSPVFIRTSSCSVSYSPTALITFVTATYSGDTVYAGSSGRGIIVTLGGRPIFGSSTNPAPTVPTVTLPPGVTIPRGTTLPTGVTIRASTKKAKTVKKTAAKRAPAKRTARLRPAL
jgi:hypothetical protein